MTTQAKQATLLAITNPHFQKGYNLGRIWYFSSFAERIGEPDDQYLLVNIESYCENSLHRDPDWLAERVGFLIGMVSCLHIPEE
jgi:hypothetical protein